MNDENLSRSNNFTTEFKKLHIQTFNLTLGL